MVLISNSIKQDNSPVFTNAINELAEAVKNIVENAAQVFTHLWNTWGNSDNKYLSLCNDCEVLAINK